MRPTCITQCELKVAFCTMPPPSQHELSPIEEVRKIQVKVGGRKIGGVIKKDKVILDLSSRYCNIHL